MDGRRVVIGVGNEYRRDDAFGLRVLGELADRQAYDSRLRGVDLRISDGEPTRLLDAWAGAGLAVVIDVADAGGRRPGEWTERDLPDGAELSGAAAASGHTIGLGTTLALGRALGRLPDRLIALVTFADQFGFGTELSVPVAAAVQPVVDRVCALVGTR
ncbi:hydrogenase maturation protease [Actinoplanes palleronii]|uniref:Peptidase M52 n=1 Tax=Actinoplanes palleronii TaxID=113570 RepID=A0ABQ4BBV8_9ACTN|nr:hydrogenase maturation protease [Actinoplanes palleronii]GIE68182.1 peptidase M52 [Actinoplanes palleronii]